MLLLNNIAENIYYLNQIYQANFIMLKICPLHLQIVRYF